jgi:hypothetical protein
MLTLVGVQAGGESGTDAKARSADGAGLGEREAAYGRE